MEKTRKIMIVEDDRTTAVYEKKVLQNNGYDVVIAHSGESAIELVSGKDRVDLILMDIDLGSGIDGKETANIILKEKDIPIVFLTSHCEKEMVDRVHQITRYGYILKNSGEFVLLSSIKMAFELFKALKIAWNQKENFRTLYESIAGGVLVVNEDYIIEDVNDITCELTGFHREELVGQLCDKLCPKGSESKKCPIWADGLDGFTGMDTKIKCNGKNMTPILKNARRMAISGKRMIFENFQDITSHKDSEMEILRVLKEKEDRIKYLEEKIKCNMGNNPE